MNCKNCGAEINEGAAFCGNCGMKIEIEQPVYEEPVQQDFQQEVHTEYQEQGYYQPPVMPEYIAEPVVSGEKPNTVLWIVLNAVQLVWNLISCFLPIASVVGLIFSILAHLSAEKEDYFDAKNKLKIAKISFWIGIGLIVLLYAVAAIFVIFGIAAAGITEGILYY